MTHKRENPWIPVDDRLPPTDEIMLVHCPDEDEVVWLGYMDEDRRWFSAIDDTPISVTDWQERPEPPR